MVNETSNRRGSEFRFKQFSVFHENSSMKVGVDGVLIGAWGKADGRRGLDIGCGCGLIALMAAQRNVLSDILAIDIDPASVTEASVNFRQSPWTDRLSALMMDATAVGKKLGTFDYILSNPPFFRSGIRRPSSSRERARHEGSLSPGSLLEISAGILNPGGTLSMIMPVDRFGTLLESSEKAGLSLQRLCMVTTRRGAVPKRVMVTFVKGESPCVEEEILFIRTETGDYSEAYKNLTSAFYLNF